jgi:hypothetical protein
MAMTVQISNGTGATTGTWAAVTAVKWNQVDSAVGTTPIPTPTATGTNFSYVKSFQIEITVVASLNMSNVKVGKVAAETTTGTKLWHVVSHSSYAQATAAPTSTGDNNVTGPTLNGAAAVAGGLALIGSAAVYAAGPFNTVARQGNIVEISLGVDATNTTAGATVATPTLRWQWTES